MHKYEGAIIAHIGPMFGGKTSAWASDVRKMQIAKYNVAAFKPAKDNRYSEEYVVTHDGLKVKSINIECFKDIINYVNEHPEIKVIAIDEFQFINSYSEELRKKFLNGTLETLDFIESKIDTKEFVKWIIKTKRTLIISGLDLDSDLVPFANVQELLPFATHIFKHKAVCVTCGADATITHCKIKKDKRNIIGGSDIYEPKCLNCWRNENTI